MIGAQAAAAPLTGHDIRLMAVLLGGIVFVAIAVSALKLHPVLALLSGGVLVGLAAGSASPAPSKGSPPASARRSARPGC